MLKKMLCFNKNCDSEGLFPAPTSKQYIETDIPQPKIYFCLEHIRIFNNNWDFFTGMSEQEIYNFQLDAITGHRKNTNKHSNHNHYYHNDINAKLNDFLNIDNNPAMKNSNYNIPVEIKESMDILGICLPLQQDTIKKKYRILVKKYHPDRAGIKSENKIKMINHAYSNIVKFIDRMEKIDCNG